MESVKVHVILEAVSIFIPKGLSRKQKQYITWLIDKIEEYGMNNIGEGICDYLMLNQKNSRQFLNDQIDKILFD